MFEFNKKNNINIKINFKIRKFQFYGVLGFQSVRRYIFRVGYVRYRLTLITANTCTCFVEVWHGHRVSAPRSFDTAHEFAEFLVSLREDAGIHSSDPEDERFESMREAAAMSGEDTE